MFDRRLIKNFDWFLLLITLLIAIVGILVIYSATHGKGEILSGELYVKQIYWLAVGLLAIMIIICVDYRTIARYAYFLYVLTILSLIWVLFKGKTGFGASRWLSLGFISFQPSELAKIIVILVLAKYFDDKNKKEPYEWRDLIFPIMIIILPTLLTLKQPDLGTSIVLVLIFLTIIFFAGFAFRVYLFLVTGGIISFISLWLLDKYEIFKLLKPYQKERLLVFINPNLDPLGSGYHIIQSKIAVGSGGFFGKGFLGGTQSQLSFLPQQHTDFIFSVLAEEWGFLGTILLLSLYLLFILWGGKTVMLAKDKLGALIAGGVIATIFIYTIINIGMTIGLMPVVGLPLPLMSYGGSSVVCTMIGVGLLLNIRMRRFMF